MGLSAEAQRRVFDAVAVMLVPVQAAGSVLARLVRFGGDVAGAGPWLEHWARLGRAAQRRNELAAQAVVRAAMRSVISLAVDEVDVDEIVARVDIDAVLARIDLAELARRVLDELDVGQVVRESSGTMAAETVDAVRTRSMRADWALSRLVDRVLQRHEARRTGLGDGPAVLGGETGPQPWGAS